MKVEPGTVQIMELTELVSCLRSGQLNQLPRMCVWSYGGFACVRGVRKKGSYKPASNAIFRPEKVGFDLRCRNKSHTAVLAVDRREVIRAVAAAS